MLVVVVHLFFLPSGTKQPPVGPNQRELEQGRTGLIPAVVLFCTVLGLVGIASTCKRYVCFPFFNGTVLCVFGFVTILHLRLINSVYQLRSPRPER